MGRIDFHPFYFTPNNECFLSLSILYNVILIIRWFFINMYKKSGFSGETKLITYI